MALGTPCALLSGAALGEAGPTGVTLESMRVTAETRHHYAVTRVETVFSNGADAADQVTLYLASSDIAFITRFALEVNGTVYESTIGSAASAREAYNSSVSAGRSAGLIELRDTNVLALALSIPAHTTLTSILAYEQMIYKVRGEYAYTFPLYATAAGAAIQDLAIEGNVSGFSAISQREVSAGAVVDPTATSFSFHYSATSLTPTENYTVRWREADVGGAGSVLVHATDEGVFFVHMFSADGAGLAAAPLPKDIVFVLDRSGSMGGLKMSQARTALGGILGQLREDDRFTVVSFDDKVEVWSDGLREASGAEVSSAQGWVSGVSARGGTDIDGGLQRGVSLLAAAGGRAPILVFLTDGLPSAGVTDHASIRSNLVARNTGGAAVFTLAFGADADFDLLQQIASENHGAAKRIYEAQDAAVQIQGFYDTFGTPSLKNVKAVYRNAQDSLAIDAATSAYAGSDLVFVGQLGAGATTLHVDVVGQAASGPVSFTADFDLSAAEGGPIVERAYAFERIRALEREAILGNTTAKDAMVSLAMKYHFVTPYTSLIVVLPVEVSRLDTVDPQAPLVPSRIGPGQYGGAPSAMAADTVPAVGLGGAVLGLALAALTVAFGRRRRA